MEFSRLKELFSDNKFITHDIVLTGGEPTLHKDFCEIVDFMCDHAKTITVTSNGTTDYYINNIKNRNNLFFQISLDGSQEVHDNIRGVGSFKKTKNTLNKLDEKGFKYSVASVVSTWNKDLMLSLEKELMQFKNMRYWRISYEMPFGSAGFNNMMSSEEWNDFVDKMLDSVRLRLQIKKIFPLELYDSKKEELDKAFCTTYRCFNCGSGKNKIYIYPDYTVYSCTCLTDFPLGNLSTLDYSEDNIAQEEYTVSEKCLLYVALTRARKSAFITGYGRMSELIV